MRSIAADSFPWQARSVRGHTIDSDARNLAVGSDVIPGGRGISSVEITRSNLKNALNWTRLSCRRFKDNQARLQLFALAYNLGKLLRQLALPRSVRTWALTTLREKPIKIGDKILRQAKALTFHISEVSIPPELLAAILGRIRSAPRGAEPRVMVHRGRMGAASGRAGRGWSAMR